MLVVGYGIFKRYSSGISKNGYPYKLLELAGDDYEKCAVNVPDDLVEVVNNFKDGDPVTVQISLASGYRGLGGTLKSIQKK